MISAWTYCLRGWLAMLMSNPRRRRNVTMVIVLAFILLVQAPNLYFNVFRRMDVPRGGATPAQTQQQIQDWNNRSRQTSDQLLWVQKVFPPLWLPAGAQALAEGRPLPALLGALGCFAIAALGLRRAYRGTLRFYRGESGGKVAAQIEPIPSPTAASDCGQSRNAVFWNSAFPPCPNNPPRSRWPLPLIAARA